MADLGRTAMRSIDSLRSTCTRRFRLIASDDFAGEPRCGPDGRSVTSNGCWKLSAINLRAPGLTRFWKRTYNGSSTPRLEVQGEHDGWVQRSLVCRARGGSDDRAGDRHRIGGDWWNSALGQPL